jgi:hypothetical protein
MTIQWRILEALQDARCSLLHNRWYYRGLGVRGGRSIAQRMEGEERAAGLKPGAMSEFKDKSRSLAALGMTH